jgi:hypothetical protein
MLLLVKRIIDILSGNFKQTRTLWRGQPCKGRGGMKIRTLIKLIPPACDKHSFSPAVIKSNVDILLVQQQVISGNPLMRAFPMSQEVVVSLCFKRTNKKKADK